MFEGLGFKVLRALGLKVLGFRAEGLGFGTLGFREVRSKFEGSDIQTILNPEPYNHKNSEY